MEVGKMAAKSNSLLKKEEEKKEYAIPGRKGS